MSLDNMLTWKNPSCLGPGLFNLGNTCFINATLQCMAYVPPLAQHLQVGLRSPVGLSGGQGEGFALLLLLDAITPSSAIIAVIYVTNVTFMFVFVFAEGGGGRGGG